MLILRSIWVWVSASVITLALSSLTIVCSYLHLGEEIFIKIQRWWGVGIMKISPVRIRIEGIENVRQDRPQIFASNHQSWYDVFVLAAVIPKRFRFVAKAELAKIPLWGRAWLAAGNIAINRDDRRKAIRTLEQFGRIIRGDNSCIVIFPEGTRSWTGELAPFKKGAFMMALHTHVDIQPVAVVGSRDIVPKGDWRVRKGTIIVRFGEPIPTAGYDNDNRDVLIELVRSRIQQLLDSPTQPGNDQEHVGDRQHTRT